MRVVYADAVNFVPVHLSLGGFHEAAMLAVISDPLFRSATTTTVPIVIPATMRLRMGNRGIARKQ